MKKPTKKAGISLSGWGRGQSDNSERMSDAEIQKGLERYPFLNNFFGYDVRDKIKECDSTVRIRELRGGGARITCKLTDELETEVIENGAGCQTATPRKRYKPMTKAASEGLTLIDQLCRKYKVNYLDELSGLAAWGKIVSKEFDSELIENIDDTNKTITYTTGVKQTKTDFLEQYRKRFEVDE